MSVDKEFRECIQKAMNEAEDKFYKYLEKEGYADCISFELTVNIVSSDYKGILETLKYSNMGSLIE